MFAWVTFARWHPKRPGVIAKPQVSVRLKHGYIRLNSCTYTITRKSCKYNIPLLGGGTSINPDSNSFLDLILIPSYPKSTLGIQTSKLLDLEKPFGRWFSASSWWRKTISTLFVWSLSLRRRASEDHRGVLDEMSGCEESWAVGEGVSGAAPVAFTMI